MSTKSPVRAFITFVVWSRSAGCLDVTLWPVLFLRSCLVDSITAMRYLPVFLRPPSLLYSVHRTQRRGWLLGLDLVTTSVMLCAICTGSLYSIASLTNSAYLCILFTIIGRHPTWSTVSPPQPVSVTVDDFGPQAANATSSREHDSNSASAVSPLLVRQLGTAFRHQFKN